MKIKLKRIYADYSPTLSFMRLPTSASIMPLHSRSLLKKNQPGRCVNRLLLELVSERFALLEQYNTNKHTDTYDP